MTSASNKVYSAKELANYILDVAKSRGISLSNMALNKLVYFAYEHALLSKGRKLTNAKIEAWDHGPVIREIYGEFKKYGSSSIEGRATRYNPASDQLELVVPNISEEDRDLVEEAIAPLIQLPAFVLRELSHDINSPWAMVRGHSAISNPGMQITDDLILSCGSSMELNQ